VFGASGSHAIEAGWFLIDAAGAGAASGASAAARNPALLDRALQVVDWAFDCGWDVAARVVPGAQAATNAALLASHAQGVGAHSGGMLYFQDACGLSPSPLEVRFLSMSRIAGIGTMFPSRDHVFAFFVRSGR
jgi:hypothetical protein